ncbi:MAG TPA: molecular chaperone DnaJ [Mycobacteriales bacterium]|nr:molecular chaperone DnaJ [Mycobacteriales bacterium]HWA65486.1 molecular chaperone DnaJ [Mycobacteriales bacterium]
MSSRDFEKDYYAMLGVPKDASAADIKKAYRKLARTHHPDANAGDAKAEEKFKEISEAYDVLSDATKRKEYDEARALFANGGFRMPPGAGRPGPGGATTFDLGDLFGGAGGGAGGLGDLFGGLFGGGRARSAAPRRGGDVEAEVTLSFTDAAAGVTLPLTISGPHSCPTCRGSGAKPGTATRVCPRCSGTGMESTNQGGFAVLGQPCRECRGRGLLIDDPCPTCSGTGEAITTRTLRARIPAGVADGKKIRLKGKGEPGERGGPAGDLIVLVHVGTHELFGRKGDNLTLTVPVTFPEAALGTTVKVPTLDGPPVTVKIPAGTASGRVLRVRGKGVTRRDGSKGDLLVTVDVAVPAQLSDEAKAALEAYAAAVPDNPRAHLESMAGAATTSANEEANHG